MNKLNEITVFNDLFSDDVQVEILTILRKPAWSMGFAPEIEGDDPAPAKLWHMNGLEDYPLFSDVLLARIRELFQTDFRLGRVYANGQLACQKGDLHRDDGDFTFLYFPLQVWRKDWGGNLVFFDDEGEARTVVSYIPNRAVSFPASVLHGAEAPARDYQGLRVSVAWKLYLPNRTLHARS